MMKLKPYLYIKTLSGYTIVRGASSSISVDLKHRRDTLEALSWQNVTDLRPDNNFNRRQFLNLIGCLVDILDYLRFQVHNSQIVRDSLSGSRYCKLVESLGLVLNDSPGKRIIYICWICI